MNSIAIKSAVYESLKPDERVRATISAIARGDDQEIENLATTCPRKSYSMRDAEFSDGMERLNILALSTESSLQAATLDWLMAMRFSLSAEAKTALSTVACIQLAWNELLSERGIDPEEMAKASPPRHFAVDTTLELANGEEDRKFTDSIIKAMRDFLTA